MNKILTIIPDCEEIRMYLKLLISKKNAQFLDLRKWWQLFLFNTSRLFKGHSSQLHANNWIGIVLAWGMTKSMFIWITNHIISNLGKLMTNIALGNGNHFQINK